MGNPSKSQRSPQPKSPLRRVRKNDRILAMAVVIRLAKIGKRGEGKYRVVVTEKRYRRDGKPKETLGWYEKRVKDQKKQINKERYDYWISKGAKPSPTVEKIVNQ